MGDDGEQSALATSDAKPQHSELIQKQLKVAGDIQMLSGNVLEQDDAMLLSSMYQSGFFKDVDSLSKAVTKAVFGKKIGIDVATAISSLVIIDGKPSLEAKAIRNTLNMAGYSIVTQKLDDKECILDWSYQGKPLGKSNFTMHDAIARGYIDPTCAALDGFPVKHNDRPLKRYNKWEKRWDEKTTCECKDNWRAMPQEMLVARATSRGNTMYGNKAFKQEVYEAGELLDSPFREDTTALDVGKDRINKAKTVDELEAISKDLQPEELTELLPEINAKTRELIQNETGKSDTGRSTTKK